MPDVRAAGRGRCAGSPAIGLKRADGRAVLADCAKCDQPVIPGAGLRVKLFIKPALPPGEPSLGRGRLPDRGARKQLMIGEGKRVASQASPHPSAGGTTSSLPGDRRAHPDHVGGTMRTLLIDNYDSYTYNLYQLMAQVYGDEPGRGDNDDPAWDALDLAASTASSSPRGRGIRRRSRDFGHSRTVLRREDVPILGRLPRAPGDRLAYGAQVVARARPRHGHLTRVAAPGEACSPACRRDSPPCATTRCAWPSRCPAELEVIAWAEDGVLMGLRHRSAAAGGGCSSTPSRSAPSTARAPGELPRPGAASADRRRAGRPGDAGRRRAAPTAGRPAAAALQRTGAHSTG